MANSTNSAKRTQKYRPYLSLEELKAIQTALAPTWLDNKNLFRYLQRYIEDIEGEIKQPVISVALHTLPTTPKIRNAEHLYNEYQQTGFSNLTPDETSSLKEYMYQNKLFTPEQTRQYESELFGL